MKTNFLSLIRSRGFNNTIIFSIIILFVCSFFARLITGSRPILCKYKSEYYSFCLSSTIKNKGLLKQDLQLIADNNFHKLDFDFAIWPIFSNDPYELNLSHAWTKPFTIIEKDGLKKNLYFGSNDVGRDIFSGCIYGLQNGMLLSLFAIFISLLFGFIPTVILSYLHSIGRKYSLTSWIFLFLAAIVCAYTLAFIFEFKSISPMALIFSVLTILFLNILAFHYRNKGRYLNFTFDQIILYFLILFQSIPLLIYFLVLSQIIIKPNIFVIGFMIGILYAPIILKYTRYFTWNRSQENFIQSKIALGFSDSNILRTCIFPNVIKDLFPIIAFGICNIVLLEASLRFLGLGMAIEEISLGAFLHQSRSFPQAWWLIIFPGICIYFITHTFYRIGEILTQDQNLKSTNVIEN